MALERLQLELPDSTSSWDTVNGDASRTVMATYTCSIEPRLRDKKLESIKITSQD